MTLPDIRTIGFHRDYDGLVAAAMVASCLPERPAFQPLDFSDNRAWPRSALREHMAVLDFPFHPAAVLWVDHHDTAFADEELRAAFFNGPAKPFHVLDPNAASCPEVILTQPWFRPLRPMRSLRTWVRWSRVIDSARYVSPAQANDLDNPHLLLAAAIPATREDAKAAEIAVAVGKLDVASVVRHPAVAGIASSIRELDRRLIAVLQRPGARVGDVVVLDQSDTDLPYRRYLPYAVHPSARFAVGIYRTASSVIVSVGENPWNRREGVHLGELCRAWGGGGRRSTAGVPAPTLADARRIADEVVAALIRAAEQPNAALQVA